MKNKILSQSFFNRDTLIAAHELLGCFLNRRLDSGGIIKAKIIETEAYIGEDDLACHASKGRTKRTEVMFGPAGRWYVYMIYGMYHCLNIVTEEEGFPAAVLIRAIDFNGANGPGKLCRDLKIDRGLNGAKAYCRASGLWITPRKIPLEPRGKPDNVENQIIASKRIGVDYAGEWKNKMWRFNLDFRGYRPRRSALSRKDWQDLKLQDF